MILKNKLFAAVLALLVGFVVALSATLGILYHKVKVFDRTHGSDVLANLSPKELFAKTNVVKKAASFARMADRSTKETEANEDSKNDEKALPEMKVVDVEYEGDDEIVLTLSERPDMDVVRNYVKVFNFSLHQSRIITKSFKRLRGNTVIRLSDTAGMERQCRVTNTM